MPKIRGVKPDYWTDEDVVDLSIPARLLFIGLWTYACDNGHLQDKPKQIKMRIFPGDDVNAAELLRELASSGRIERADGWITIPNLTEHQKPDLRYFTTCDKEGCDDPPEKVSQRQARRAHAGRTPGQQGAHAGRTAGAHVDGDGDGDGEVMVKGTAAGKPATARKRAFPNNFEPSDTNRRLAAERNLDLAAVIAHFRDHHESLGNKFIDWDKALSTWLRREKPQPPSPPVRHLPHASELETPPDGLSPEEYAAWDRDRRARRRA